MANTLKSAVFLGLLLGCIVGGCRAKSEAKVEDSSYDESLDDYLADLSKEMDDLDPLYDINNSQKKTLNQQVDRQLEELEGSLGGINSFLDDPEIKTLMEADPNALDEESRKVRESLLESKRELDQKIAELQASIAELEKLKAEAAEITSNASSGETEAVDSEEKSLAN